MSFLGRLLALVASSPSESACYLVLWDEPEAPRSIIEK